MKDIKDKKLLYHLTSLDNLNSIIANGLMSREELIRRGLHFQDVADPEILSKRGNLDKYVPFHFHPYSSFDKAVKSTYFDKKFIYICIYRSFARSMNFYILPRHPLNMNQIEIFDYDEGFDKIDWETMNKNLDEVPFECQEYQRQVRMAECLSPNTIPVNVFQSIIVPDEKIQNYVENELGRINHNIYVNIGSYFN